MSLLNPTPGYKQRLAEVRALAKREREARERIWRCFRLHLRAIHARRRNRSLIRWEWK